MHMPATRRSDLLPVCPIEASIALQVLSLPLLLQPASSPLLQWPSRSRKQEDMGSLPLTSANLLAFPPQEVPCPRLRASHLLEERFRLHSLHKTVLGAPSPELSTDPSERHLWQSRVTEQRITSQLSRLV